MTRARAGVSWRGTARRLPPGAPRENGGPTLADCRLAVLEVDGTISVIANRT